MEIKSIKIHEWFELRETVEQCNSNKKVRVWVVLGFLGFQNLDQSHDYIRISLRISYFLLIK